LSEVGSAYLFFDGAEHLLGSAPAYTASLDAITVLIERAFGQMEYSSGKALADVSRNIRGYHWARLETDHDALYGEANTEPLARCVAFLRALQARGERNG